MALAVRSAMAMVIGVGLPAFETAKTALPADLPPRTIPLFKLELTPLEGRADTVVASM